MRSAIAGLVLLLAALVRAQHPEVCASPVETVKTFSARLEFSMGGQVDMSDLYFSCKPNTARPGCNWCSMSMAHVDKDLVQFDVDHPTKDMAFLYMVHPSTKTCKSQTAAPVQNDYNYFFKVVDGAVKDSTQAVVDGIKCDVWRSSNTALKYTSIQYVDPSVPRIVRVQYMMQGTLQAQADLLDWKAGEPSEDHLVPPSYCPAPKDVADARVGKAGVFYDAECTKPVALVDPHQGRGQISGLLIAGERGTVPAAHQFYDGRVKIDLFDDGACARTDPDALSFEPSLFCTSVESKDAQVNGATIASHQVQCSSAGACSVSYWSDPHCAGSPAFTQPLKIDGGARTCTPVSWAEPHVKYSTKGASISVNHEFVLALYANNGGSYWFLPMQAAECKKVEGGKVTTLDGKPVWIKIV